MRQVMYVMQFKGEGLPGDDGKLHAKTSSGSSSITTTVGNAGVEAQIAPASGGSASFTSEVAMTGESTFTETGEISFGDGASLTFSTVGEGLMGPSPVEGLLHGTIMWRVESGSGQFEGASGLITSNFTFDGEGKVTDHQWGVLWVRD